MQWINQSSNIVKLFKMGWFSADEIVAPAVATTSANDVSTQTVAVCALAIVVTGYLLGEVIVKLHRHHTERVTERTARRLAIPL